MKKKEAAPNTTLILYSDIFSSAENLNYWQKKLEKQMKASSPFGLVAIIDETHITNHDPEIDLAYKEWIEKIRPALQLSCYGHAIVTERNSVKKKYNSHHLKRIESTIGCECRLFQELDSALCWLDQKDKTFVLS